MEGQDAPSDYKLIIINWRFLKRFNIGFGSESLCHAAVAELCPLTEVDYILYLYLSRSNNTCM